MKIKQLPPVLVIHLKRFKYQERLERFTKMMDRVAFPRDLSLFHTVGWAFARISKVHSNL